jgi:formylglycine-generating enzyme required for sulfatase activity/serine/threonine protein kinase
MTSNDPLALVGTTVLDKYQVERVVGEGGFAVVYRARHMVWDRPVAIKVFRALGDLAPERRDELMESFIQEGRLLAELSERSAAICQARDVGMLKTGDGRDLPYMVLEWLEGQTLEQVLASEQGMPPRTPEQALRLLEPAAEALALAHRKGIAHRDVKPANIFILGDPRGEFTVKLLDFGIAKVVQDAQRLDHSFGKTQGVVSSFTPSYGAPEQFSRAQGATGPWTDVFAMALIFDELLTNEPPLRGDDLTQLAVSAMDPLRRPTPKAHGLAVPDALEAVLLRAVAVNPSERYRSMSELWEELRAALGMDAGRASVFQDTSPSPSKREGAPASPALPQPAEGNTVQQTERKSVAATFVVGGIAVFVAVLALVGGVWFFALRGHDDVAVNRPPTKPSAAPSVASAAPIVSEPRPAACPSGMTKIPGGKYFMGSDDRKDEENQRPAHQVTLSPYCMDTTEVTVAQYKACSDTGECKRAPDENDWEGIDARAHKLYDPLCNIRDPEGKRMHPINCIDWELASAFCKANGKRLPTEAEWEYATRGSDGRKYPWGDEPPTTGTFLNACGKECVAWGRAHPDPDNPLSAMYNVDDHWPNTAPVGSFPKGASPFGLQDVVGNVWEWVSDWYGPYSSEGAIDPTGPATGTERVLRGGAWNGSDPAWVRPSYRFKLDPKLRSHGIGMRCAKSLVQGDAGAKPSP